MTETPGNFGDREALPPPAVCQPSLNDRLNSGKGVLADTADLVLMHNEALIRIERAVERLTDRVDALIEAYKAVNHELTRLIECWQSIVYFRMDLIT